MAKLIDILARELKVWPHESWAAVGQSVHGSLHEIHPPASRLCWTEKLYPMADDWTNAQVTRTQWQAAVDALKAEKVVEWSGEGLPPVGTVCEYTSNGGLNWRETSVLFIDEQVVLLTGYPLYKLADPNIAFRPIFTPEQIAEKERDQAIEDLYFTINWDEGRETWPIISSGRKADYAKAIDAGYRKQK